MALPSTTATQAVDVAGQHLEQQVPVSTGAPIRVPFRWDGRDRFGRRAQGEQPFNALASLVYPARYLPPDERERFFGRSPTGYIDIPDVVADRSREQVVYTSAVNGRLGNWDSTAEQIGGWTLDAQHHYHANTRTLVRGDGSRTSIDSWSPSLSHVRERNPSTGELENAFGGIALDVGADGTIYLLDAVPGFGGYALYAIAPDGTRTRLVGAGDGTGSSDDHIPALQAQPLFGNDVAWDHFARAPDGTIYLSERSTYRVRRVRNGVIDTVAGNGVDGTSEPTVDEGAVATSVPLGQPWGLAVGPDGTLYIADRARGRVFSVSPEGRLHTVAGGAAGSPAHADGVAATAQTMIPLLLAVGPDGQLYVYSERDDRIRRVDASGRIFTVAGSGTEISSTYDHDGELATDAGFYALTAMQVGRDGFVYTADGFLGEIRRFDPTPEGHIYTIAAGCAPDRLCAPYFGSDYNGQPAIGGSFRWAYGMALAPDGTLLFSDGRFFPLPMMRLGAALPGLGQGVQRIPDGGGSVVHEFDPLGWHLRTRNTLTGATLLSFVYDGSGRLLRLVDGDGNETSLERDGDGRVSALEGPDGHRSTLSYGSDGMLARVTDPASRSVQMTYEDGGLLHTWRDARGHVSTMEYDGNGRLVSDVGPDGYSTTLSFVERTDGHEVRTQSTMGRVTRQITQRYVSGFVRGPETRTTVTPDGAENSTVSRFDGTSESHAQDGTIARSVLAGDPRFGMAAAYTSRSEVVLPSGLTSVATQQRSVTLADPGDPAGVAALTYTSSVNGQTTSASYDGTLRQWTTTSPAGRTSQGTIDADGRVVRTEVPGIEPMEFGYDARGRLSSVTQGTRTVSRTYDARGRTATLTDPAGRTTSFVYDDADRVTAHTLGSGRVVRFAYDENDNVISVTPPSRPAHTATYTAADQVASYEPPELTSGPTPTAYTYTADRQVLDVTLPSGAVIHHSYDTAGRLTAVTTPRGVFTYDYDATTRQLVSAHTPEGQTTTATYDGSRVASVSWSGTVSGSVAWTHDSDGRVTSEQVGGAAAVEFAYDRDGLLTQAGPLTLTRSPLNGLETGGSAGEIHHEITLDSMGARSAEAYRVGSEPPFYAVTYTYNASRQITERSETVEGTTHTFGYAYDTAGRLAEELYDGASVATYSYDAMGNRLSRVAGATTEIGTYDDQDRTQSYGGYTYSFDANGRLQQRVQTATGDTLALNYDAAGNLLSATLPDGRVVSYVLDAAGRRIARRVDGVMERGWLYRDGLRPVAELDATGAVQSVFVYAGTQGAPDLVFRGGSTYRLIKDQIGSPRMLVESTTGAVVATWERDAWGRLRSESGVAAEWISFGFAGGLWDRETSLVHFGARDFESINGRWTAKEPLGLAATSASFYQYGEGDSVNTTDPDGRIWQGALWVAAGALLALNGYELYVNLTQHRGLYLNEAAMAVAVGGTGGQLALEGFIARATAGIVLSGASAEVVGAGLAAGQQCESSAPRAFTGIAYQIKFISKHLEGTPQAARELRRGAIHVFHDMNTLARVENEIFQRGELTGRVRGVDRFGLQFTESIGTRIDQAGNRMELFYGEAKVVVGGELSGWYHIFPRTGPAE